jgi:formylglycine-generating enzyme required for sulfatase activity
MNRPLRVFLCHSSKDKSAVRELYKKLRAEPWIDPWLDEEKLLPGQDWHMEIEKAVEATDVVVVLLSNQSVSQEGFVQRELKLALDMADEKPEGTIFITPLRLDDCPAPRRLRGWHYVDYFPVDHKNWAVERLIAGLKTRAESLGLEFEEPVPPKINETPVSQVSNSTKTPPSEQNWSQKWMPSDEVLNVPKSSQAKSLTYETPKPASIPQISSKQKYTTDGFLVEILRGMEFMHVPAGKFLMGSDNGEDNERPQHIVDIPYDYWMARYPVTNEQYDLYVKAKGVLHPVHDWQNKKDHPVVNISWNTVMEYCLWLSSILKTELLSSTMTVRLPTEAEWEKAARGTDDRQYPWGNTFDKNKCNSNEGKKAITTSIGSYSPQGDSLYGCADMAGNVWEWTHSEYKAYPYDFKDGREKKQKNVARVVRGGAYYFDEKKVRCTSRSRSAPHDWSGGFGFRVVVAPPLLHS